MVCIADLSGTARDFRFVPTADIAHAIDFRVFFATSIKARSFGAKEARRG